MSTQCPHKSWCSQSNVTMCNCRFPSGDDYIPGHHGPAPEPGACVFCGKRCYSRSPCAKRKEAAEGVAAPLEPSPEQFIESRLVPPLLHGDEAHQEWLRGELRKWIPDLKLWAAAVSKNLQEELATEIAKKQDWWQLTKEFQASSFKALERILELEKEITALRETK